VIGVEGGAFLVPEEHFVDRVPGDMEV
jgi:hypothetical protein